MDFSAEVMNQLGHGLYSRIELGSDLPRFFLAYIGDPSDSGKIHNDVFARWKAGDPEVLEAVRMFAQVKQKCLQKLLPLSFFLSLTHTHTLTISHTHTHNLSHTPLSKT
jgi:hypothetical protein